MEEAITSLGKTANRIADERNQFKAERDRLRSVNGKLLEALHHIEGLEARADGCEGMVDNPHLKAFRAAVIVARAAIKAAEEEAVAPPTPEVKP